MGKTERIIKKIRDAGLKVHMQLLSNDEGVDGFHWQPEELEQIRLEMDQVLSHYDGVTYREIRARRVMSIAVD